ncbi:MAG: GIY-YIG nuclease family protein [Candidatus Saccharibacteria bacterium]|nr:GIY-YIG nuclease family protein [Candidatus Saccharibacteria bacterium]
MSENTETPQKHWWLYVLKLEQGKFYVGITSKTPEERFQQHVNGFLGAQWTKKYKPIELTYKEDLGNVTLEQAKLAENMKIRMYMNMYGDENVRGGDLNYSGKYFYRFGRFHRDEDWQIVTVILFLSIVITLLLLDKLGLVSL